jgi:O-antigen/teichoic acid export membrane protein
MASLDRSRDYDGANGKKIEPYAHPLSYSRESEHDRSNTTELEQAQEISDLPILVLQNVNIDELPTSVNLKAADISSSSCTDDLPVEQRPTWILPAIQAPTKAAEPEAQDQEVQGYDALIQKLVKSSGIYALASLISPLVSLLLAPFLTHHLSRADYGALAILNTFVVLLAGVTQLGLSSAFFRAYGYDYESQRDRLDVLSTSFMLLLLISLPITITGIVAAPSLAIILLNAPSLSSAIRISALVILLQNLTVPGLAWLRAETRSAFFSTISIVNLLVSAGATILFVGIMHMGIEGALFATAMGYAVIVFCTVPMILLRAGIRLRFDIARGMLGFGFPHVLNLLAGWVLQLLDRYLLGLLGSLSQTASYAVAYSLGGALSAILITPFSLAWWIILYSIAKRDDAQRVFQLIFRWFSIILLFAAFGLSIFGTAVLDLFFPVAYHSAAAVIPVIAMSIMFNGVSIVVAVGISLHRKTWLATLSLTSSAIINTILNFILIPHYGAMGAAVATLLAYAALALIDYVLNKRIYPVPFETGRFLIALSIGIALYAGCSLLAPTQQFYIAWAIRIGSLGLYGGCLALLGKLPDRSYKHR